VLNTAREQIAVRGIADFNEARDDVAVASTRPYENDLAPDR